MAGLKQFIKGSSDPEDMTPGCASYDYHYGGCLFADDCKVEKSRRCGYFERAVLPTAGQLKQGNKIIEEYKRRTGIEKGLEIRKAKIRLCECGATLPSGAQYCDRCQIRHKQEKYRKYRDRRRNVSRATEVDILPVVSADESKT